MKFSLGDNYIKSLAAGIIYGAQYTPTVGAAKNVFDGLRTSSWFPCNGTTIADAWIGLAYMTAKEVNRAVIDFNNPYYTPTNYVLTGFVIEYANDDGIWYNAYTSGTVNVTNQILTVDFPAITAKRWRFRMTNCPSWKNREVSELTFSKV